MRKFVLSLAAVGSALAFATPAAAQYYPPQGNAYGYNNYGQVRSLHVRIDNLQRRIEQLRNRRLISRNEANGLRSDSRELERRLYRAGRNGLNFNEIRNVEYRLARLEQRLRHEVRDDNRWGSNDGRFYDRDRDGRDDRYENDRGTRYN